MNIFLAEFIGTALLILLGNGVVANVILSKTKGNGGGLIAITLGWAVAVFIAVYITAPISGGHLNPAVSIALACINKISWSLVPTYIAAQLMGSIAGAFLVYIVYKKHFDATTDAATQISCFCTSAAISHKGYNMVTEIVGTFVLVFAALSIPNSTHSLGAINALPVALVVLGIGLSLGGPTGYAINPARDFGPRLVYSILPFKQKIQNHWQYAIVPIVAPIIGAVIAAYIFAYWQG